MAIKLLLADKTKEYHCHIMFVSSIAIDLACRFQVNTQIVEISALFHDIGRDKEIENESHEVASSRITEQIIQKISPDLLEKELILNCIRHHNNKIPVHIIEEKILISADGASKIIYHPAFMLMCKKENFVERAEWGIKYLEKGLKNILFPDFRKEVVPLYRQYRQVYQQVLRDA